MAEAQPDDQSQSKGRYHGLFIRCIGIHDEMKHYIGFGIPYSETRTRKETINLYKLIVDERIEQVTVVEHDSENVLLQSCGGLLDSAGKMTVIDPMQNAFRGTLDNSIIDFKIREQPVQHIRWGWALRPFNPREYKKNLWVRNQFTTRSLCEIWGIRESTTVSIRFLCSYVRENKLPQLAALMAILKYYYGVQQYHQHPVPVGILGLMQKGMPCFPSLSILDNMSRVRIRTSCMNSESHHWLDVLDENTREILLVIRDTPGNQTFDFQFRDTYGITQFARQTQNTNGFFVQDHEGSIIGNICLTTKIISAANDKDSHLTVAKLDRAHSQLSNTTSFQIICNTGTSSFVVAEFYFDYLSSNMMLSMLKDLDVHKKALALTQAMLTALLFYKIHSKTMLPIFPGYSYRQH